MIQPWPWESVVRDTGDSPECQHKGLYWAQLTNERPLTIWTVDTIQHVMEQQSNQGGLEARCWVIKGTLDCVFTDWDLTMRSFHGARVQYVDWSVLHDLCQSGVIIMCTMKTNTINHLNRTVSWMHIVHTFLSVPKFYLVLKWHDFKSVGILKHSYIDNFHPWCHAVTEHP